ncbi:hypothetical protein [Proteus phage 10]|nr:hypothetical protein [Proteus phage 10]
MFKTPYETTAARFYKTDNIKKELRDAKADGLLTSAEVPVPVTPASTDIAGPVLTKNHWYVLHNSRVEDLVQPFFHPIIFKDSMARQNIAINLRESVSDGGSEGLVIRNRNGLMDAEQQIIRMKAVWFWHEKDPEAMLNISTLPIKVFGRWVTEPIARNLGLGFDITPRLLAYTSYFFLCQFADREKVEHDFLINCMNRISIQAGIDRHVVMDVLGAVPFIGTIAEFCEHAKEHVGSEQLGMLTPKLMVRICGNAWFGANAQESSAIALEFPPYLMSMMYGVIGSRLYRNTALGNILERKGIREHGEDFRKSFSNLITN